MGRSVLAAAPGLHHAVFCACLREGWLSPLLGQVPEQDTFALWFPRPGKAKLLKERQPSRIPPPRWWEAVCASSLKVTGCCDFVGPAQSPPEVRRELAVWWVHHPLPGRWDSLESGSSFLVLPRLLRAGASRSSLGLTDLDLRKQADRVCGRGAAAARDAVRVGSVGPRTHGRGSDTAQGSGRTVKATLPSVPRDRSATCSPAFTREAIPRPCVCMAWGAVGGDRPQGSCWASAREGGARGIARPRCSQVLIASLWFDLVRGCPPSLALWALAGQ